VILMDAGPLVALIHAGDQWHRACLRTFERLDEPVVTVWPVVTEAMYLLGFSTKAQDALWGMLERETPRILPLELGDLPPMRALMRQYRDRPMDLADAALVRVAERERLSKIFTVDITDFRVYRIGRRGRFDVLKLG
jgi:uncharacterized protein